MLTYADSEWRTDSNPSGRRLRRQEEKKEDTAWEQAIVSQEQKIANGEEVCDVMCMHVRTRRVFKRLLPQSDSRLDYCYSTGQHCHG